MVNKNRIIERYLERNDLIYENSIVGIKATYQSCQYLLFRFSNKNVSET